MAPTLIADIGGSNTRLALADASGRHDRVLAFRNDALDGLESAIEAYVAKFGERFDGAVLAIAGPVQSRRIALTNRDWVIDLDLIERRFGLRYARAINDFEAFAWALPQFGPEDLRPIGLRAPTREGPLVAVGPGTGLGVAALVPEEGSSEGGWVAVASEAGHMSFGPGPADEWPVFERVAKTVEAVSAEAVICGRGLERLYVALHPERPGLSARDIDDTARAGEPAALAAVALFVRLLGRFAGDMALTFKATGGVYVGGGVAQKLGRLIEDAPFRAAFEAHPPYRHLLETIPTVLVTCEDPGLLGCAAHAAHLGRKAPPTAADAGRLTPRPTP